MEKTWILKRKISKTRKDVAIKGWKIKEKKVDSVLEHDLKRNTENIEIKINDLKKERGLCKIRLWMIVYKC